jgi:hypothetical protein
MSIRSKVSAPITALRAGVLRLRWFELVGVGLLIAGFVLIGLGWWQRSWLLLVVSLGAGVVAAGLLSTRINPGQVRPKALRDQIVWVGKRSRRYHLRDCALLGNSAHEMTREEAIEAGLPGCEICGSAD